VIALGLGVLALGLLQALPGRVQVGLDLLRGLVELVLAPVGRLLGLRERLLDLGGHVVGHAASPFGVCAGPISRFALVRRRSRVFSATGRLVITRSA
jgi:hypothetical protein